MYRKLFPVIILICCSFALKAQNWGIPHINNYSPSEYNGFAQNWSAEQDIRGVMYFANGKGILEYDGQNWRRFFTDKASTVLSLGKDTAGRVYVGGEGEIGFLGPDSLGTITYHSLLHLLPDSELVFSYVWHIYANNTGVFFVTPEKVIRINGKKVKIWKSKTSFFTGFMTNDVFYVVDNSNGLNQLIADSLTLIPDGHLMYSTRAILPGPGDSITIIGNKSGIYRYKNFGKPRKIETNTIKIFEESSLYKGVITPLGNYAFATLNNGVIITDQDCNIQFIINEDNGLISNSVYALFYDRDQELWANTSNGLSRIETTTPLRFITDQMGLEGIVQQVCIIDSTIFIGTLSGLFSLDLHKNSSSKIKQLPFSGQIYKIIAVDNQLIIAGSGGIYSFANNNFQLLHNESYVLSLAKSKFHKYKILWGGVGQVGILSLDSSNPGNKFIYSGGNEEIHSIAELNEDKIFVGTTIDGILEISYQDSLSDSSIVKLNTANGIPQGMTELFQYKDEIFVGTSKGIMRFDRNLNRFVWSNMVDHSSNNYAYLLYPTQDSLWMYRNNGIQYIKYNDTSNNIVYQPLLRLTNIFNDFYTILPIPGKCIMGGTEGLVIYTPNDIKDYTIPYQMVFNLIFTNKDTIINGAFSDSNYNILAKQNKEYAFKYKENSISFIYSCPYFGDENAVLTSFILEGFDEFWSDWNTNWKKEYTNLPEGNYTFKVKAQNIYYQESEELVFEFSILPPWYRTIWAYILFFITGTLLLIAIIYLNSRRLIAAKKRLERIVAQRTAEIRKQNDEILQQKEEIETQRDQLMDQNDEILQQKEEIEAQRDEIIEQKELAIEQRDMIAYQKTEITDSILYARRIQTALLPEMKKFNSFFTDHFIFFKPRDIVSGDFYWSKMLDENTFIFTAADCTGHGVPGAFMSMLGITYLSEITGNLSNNEINNISAAGILDKLKDSIIQSLSSRNANYSDSVKDGMDMVLCIYHKKENTLQFAGANNPLYLFRNAPIDQNIENSKSATFGNVSLIEIKGDKMPVGIHYKTEEHFHNHTIKPKKGDQIYLFSDGYADQFGGPKGKKFKYSSLKKLFAEMHNLEGEKQKELLEQNFDGWISAHNEDGQPYEQIDDVIILGVKL
ncbi:MAG: hypothetical protein C0594_16585 [Marinilabiliales bacterium]|nr:MAG: hypothetical protein C0594_16585 [Marinilabiliales bacterium]